MTIGVYPGSFDPPTIAHVAIARAAIEQCGLDRLDLVISVAALGKEPDQLNDLAHRVELLEAVAAGVSDLGVRTTDAQLLVDISEGYDVVVLGADKWAQVVDPSWYGTTAARDEALARLPLLAIAPRGTHPHPDPALGRFVVLDIDPAHHHVSATEVRDGRHDWLAPEAATRLATLGRLPPATSRPMLRDSTDQSGPTGPTDPVPAKRLEGELMTETAGSGSSLGPIRRQRERLARAADELEEAIAGPGGDLGVWMLRVQAAVVDLDDALAHHVEVVEAPDGLFADVMARTPRLAHRIDQLRDDHADLRERLSLLEPLLAEPAATTHTDPIREAALGLLGEISRHRHRGADLIWDSYDFDIGSSE